MNVSRPSIGSVRPSLVIASSRTRMFLERAGLPHFYFYSSTSVDSGLKRWREAGESEPIVLVQLGFFVAFSGKLAL